MKIRIITTALLFFVGATIIQRATYLKTVNVSTKIIDSCSKESQRWFDSAMLYKKFYYNK